MTANPYLEANFYKRFRRYYTYIEPVISDPVVRSYFSIIASLILIALFLIFALSPTLTTILGLVKKIDDQKKTISAMDQKINDLITAQDSYNSFQPHLPALVTALPDTAVPETALDSIYLAASASAVVISTLQFGDIPVSSTAALRNLSNDAGKSLKLDKVKVIDFSMVVTGAPEKVETFLTRLEKMRRIIKIINLSFGSKKGTMTISAKSFFLPKNFP